MHAHLSAVFPEKKYSNVSQLLQGVPHTHKFLPKLTYNSASIRAISIRNRISVVGQKQENTTIVGISIIFSEKCTSNIIQVICKGVEHKTVYNI